MIFNQYVGFLDEFSVNVEVFTTSGTAVGSGNLSVKKNRSPQVNFDLNTDIFKYAKQKVFICKSEKYQYQLLECDIFDNTIFPSIFIRGKEKRAKFKKVYLLLQGLSQWMDSNGSFELTDSEIIRKRDTRTFDVEINLGGKKISLSNEHWCDTKHVKDNNYQLNQYSLLRIESKNSSWSITELIAIINDIRTFFTLLLGHSIGVEYVLDATAKNTTQSVYFVNATRDTNEAILPEKCFVSSSFLFKKNKWEGLLQGYFSGCNEQYKNVWARISGMLSYEGFWEYRILAYISLVDRYVSIFAKNEESSLSPGQFRKHRRVARISLENLKSECKLTNEDKEKFNAVIDSMCTQVSENIHNTSISSFNDKFDLKVSRTNLNIIEVLGFKDVDFTHLKQLRNSVAHGDEPKIQNESNITYEVTVTNKVVLLLRYWTFIDIGFTHSEFIGFLRNWMYPITQQAQINKVSLDVAAGNYLFLKTNKTNFLKAKKYNFKCLILDYVKSSDTFRVNDKATEHVGAWLFNRDKTTRTVEEELMAFVDTTKVKNVAYLGISYLKYKDELVNLSSGACILNCPEYISSHGQVKDRLRVFDDFKNTWLPSEFEKRIGFL
ncbi:hypothetical protein Q4503_09330 [Colwellia sp. 6_MG-2023]|uniref:ApeA N-terminal domain 1-containing protein n=1 Tax=Colwellia sp. 6_MG-2023 TaxID=3062676 RepID=UPI0026E25108|nr:HEPN domain-containing protein [Colwellia sp. 6_MG-2023]MDO6487901.1 hypothetical protein [Colwellia sp. 6_MG-2023]